MTMSRGVYSTKMNLDKRIELFRAECSADACWTWPGRSMKNGYASSTTGRGPDKRAVYVHRYAYEKLVGPIPEGLVIDHLCRNRLCFNPAHLEVTDHRTNILRGTGASARCAVKTHCPKGHPYEGDNLVLRPNGFRRCRTCDEQVEQKRDRRSEPWYKRRQETRAAKRAHR